MSTVAAFAFALVVQDDAALRAEPTRDAVVHAALVQGDLLEMRGRRLDHLQVWDHRRERAGYVAADQVRVLQMDPADAPSLRSVMRFLRDRPGAEALGIAYAAATLQALPANVADAEPFDAIAEMAGRLADRASAARGRDAERVQRHLDAVGAYGVHFVSAEHDGRVTLCYEGDAARRVLAMLASPEAQARAVLALTRPDCRPDAAAAPTARRAAERDQWAALSQAMDAMPAGLDPLWRNRLQMRRAELGASIAFGRARAGEDAAPAAEAALTALAAVDRDALADDDRATYERSTLAVAAVRWAALPAAGAGKVEVSLAAGEPGQTCVVLRTGDRERARRCTWGVPWPASARSSADGASVVLSVQTMPGWTELWVFRRDADGGYVAQVLPPAAEPGLGYVEFAGWVPGGRQMMVARETWQGGRLRRRFELVALDGLATELWASDADRMGAFARWPDRQWRRTTLSLR